MTAIGTAAAEELGGQLLATAMTAGAEAAEGCLEERRIVRRWAMAGQVLRVEDRIERGIAIRIMAGGRLGFLSTTDLRPRAIDAAIRDPNSPSDDWEPRVSLGIGVGF